MVRSRLGLKALALCGLVLGLMAFIVSAAQAEAGAKWNVVKAGTSELIEVKEGGLLPFVGIKEIEKLKEANGEEVKHAVLLTKIAGVKVEFLCTGAELTGTKLEKSGSLTSGGKVKFTGCLTKLNGATSAPCEPKAGGTEAGVIVTGPGKGLLVLHVVKETVGGKEVELKIPITRIEHVPAGKEGETATEKETLAVIELGKECSIGNKVPVIGKLTLEDPGGVTTESVDHLIKEGPLTELWTISKTAEHVATIDGSALVALTEEHTGLKWNGIPG